MKKFLFLLGIIAIAGGVFVGGIVIGAQLDFMHAMFSVSILERELTDASRVFLAISYLDEGNTVGAKGMLNQELNSHIVTIDQFTKDSPKPKTEKHAMAFLARIAAHRQKYPLRIDISKDDPGQTEVDMHVQAVLDDALKQKEEQNKSLEANRKSIVAPPRNWEGLKA